MSIEQWEGLPWWQQDVYLEGIDLEFYREGESEEEQPPDNVDEHGLATDAGLAQLGINVQHV